MAYTPYSDIYSFVAKVLNHYETLDKILVLCMKIAYNVDVLSSCSASPCTEDSVKNLGGKELAEQAFFFLKKKTLPQLIFPELQSPGKIRQEARNDRSFGWSCSG
ncbi:MAG: hypothetical protein A3E60_03005 [Candidatus Kerfeldbacteria bacterium RIFCSPHIGHO2_12_FULL_42_13]|nr:MAG: hypothetical protein A3E60_03005 [Candidatus Kerfeldbacteria bacterium RIFCSPHIGHO2_12_FULL_42_13]